MEENVKAKSNVGALKGAGFPMTREIAYLNGVELSGEYLVG